MKKNIFEMNKRELKSILANADDYSEKIINIAKERLEMMNNVEDDNVNDDDILCELIECQQKNEKHLENISKKVNGISYIMWFYLVVSIIAGICWVSMLR